MFSVLVIMLSQPLTRGDIYPHHVVDIEGAHMVSEGAYFRFLIDNPNALPINVTINGDTLSIPPRSGVDYDVVAPFISVPFEQVTKFSITGSNLKPTNDDVTVLVMNSAWVEVFDLTIPILITIATIIVALVTVVIIRRRSHKKP